MFQRIACERLGARRYLWGDSFDVVSASADVSRWQINPSAAFASEEAGLDHQLVVSESYSRSSPQSGPAESLRVAYGSVDDASFSQYDIGSTIDGLGPGTRTLPSVAFDRDDDRGYLVYTFRPTDGGPSQLVFATTLDGGASFQGFKLLGPGLTLPRIAAGPDDQVYIVTRNLGHQGRDAIFLLGSNNAGASFVSEAIDEHIPPTIPNQEAVAVQTPDIAVSENGAVHLTWHRNVLNLYHPSLRDGQVYYDVDSDGMFASEQSFGTDLLIESLGVGTLHQENVFPTGAGIYTAPVIDLIGETAYIAYNKAWVRESFAPPPLVRDCVVLMATIKNSAVTSVANATPSGTTLLAFHQEIAINAGVIYLSYYFADGGPNQQRLAKPRIAHSIDGKTFSSAIAVDYTTNEIDGFHSDYGFRTALYITASKIRGFFSFRTRNPAPLDTDLDIYSASTRLVATPLEVSQPARSSSGFETAPLFSELEF